MTLWQACVADESTAAAVFEDQKQCPRELATNKFHGLKADSPPNLYIFDGTFKCEGSPSQPFLLGSRGALG
jgi:hypothetical protein